MDNQYRSPLRAVSKSTAKHSKSVTIGKRSKYKQQSESKNHAALVKEISDRQPYKNLLNRLLRAENLTKFVREAEKYVELTEDIVAPYKSKSHQNQRSRNQFQEYGKALLKDGSFIRYYCKLVEKEFYEDRKKLRELFYEKYRHEICLREKMFNDYFKEEINNVEDSITFSFTKSKIKEKAPIAHSRSKSHKKAKTEISFCMKQTDKAIDNLSAIEHVESSNSIETKDSKHSEREVSKSQIKKTKIVHFQKQPVVEEVTYEEENYRSPYLNYNPNETQEQRQLRLSGLGKPTRFKSNEKRKSIIVKFQDEIKSNQKLKEIYNQLVKEKEQRQKQGKSNEKTTNNSSTKPVVRSSLSHLPEIVFSQVKMRELNNDDKSKLSVIQTQILSFYPTVHLKAHKRGVQISAVQTQGYYKNYIIHKAVITDINHYREPDFIGIIAERMESERTQDMKECTFEPDDRVEVILFD